MTRVVDAVSRQEIENPMAVRGEQLRSHAPFITKIHFQQIEKPNPLRIHVLRVSIRGEAFSCWHGLKSKGQITTDRKYGVFAKFF